MGDSEGGTDEKDFLKSLISYSTGTYCSSQNIVCFPEEVMLTL
jgi:hypothetical protein